MRACVAGHLSLVQFFIRLGVNASLKTEPQFNNETAIYKAAKAKQTAVVAELMAGMIERNPKVGIVQ